MMSPCERSNESPAGPTSRPGEGVDGVLDISVVLTTRDRAARLRATLESLVEQTLAAAHWEILVVDNASSDHTPTVLRDLADRLPLRCLTVTKPGKCHAQNQALPHCRGRLLVFTDDDVAFDRDWLAALAAALERWPDADILGGQIRVDTIGAVPEWLQGDAGAAIIARHSARYAPRADAGETEVAPIGPNMAIRRRALGDTRFDERLGPDGSADYVKGGDTDICRLLMVRGARCVYVADAIVTHRVDAEQLQLAALFAGVYRRGRKNGLLSPPAGGLRIAGVPLRYWLKLARQWLRFRLAGSRPMTQYRLGTKYHYWRGVVDQLRRQARAD